MTYIYIYKKRKWLLWAGSLGSAKRIWETVESESLKVKWSKLWFARNHMVPSNSQGTTRFLFLLVRHRWVLFRVGRHHTHLFKMMKFFMLIIFLTSGRVTGEICTSEICEYTLRVQHARTMTYHSGGETYNVELDGEALRPVTPDRFHRSVVDVVPPDDVITADGLQRNILTINGQFPGPTIEVTEGAQVFVTLIWQS